MNVSMINDLEEMFLKRHGRQLRELEDKNRNLQFVNDDLRKKLCYDENRSHQLAARLGFSDIAALEDAVAAKPSLWNADAIEQSHCLANDLRGELNKHILLIRAAQEVHKGTLAEVTVVKQECAEVQQRNFQLSQELNIERTSSAKKDATIERLLVELEGLKTFAKPSTSIEAPSTSETLRVDNPPAGLSDSTATTPLTNSTRVSSEAFVLGSPKSHIKIVSAEYYKTQLATLAQKYDDLLEKKNAAAKKYLQDFKKWKALKEWLYTNAKGNEQKSTRKRISSRKLQQLADVVDRIDITSLDDEHLTESRRAPSPDPSDRHHASLISVRRRSISPVVAITTLSAQSRRSTGHGNTIVRDALETAGSTRYSSTKITPSQSKPVTPPAGDPSETPAADDLASSGRSTSLKRKRRSGSPMDAGSPNVNSRQVNQIIAPECTASPMTERGEVQLPRAPSTAIKSQGLEVSAVERGDAVVGDKTAGQSLDGYKDDTTKMDVRYTSPERRGRYGHSSRPSGHTINSLYEIATDKNHGLSFQFDGVVRNRDERRRMEAGDCECCRDYYASVAPLPPRLKAPLWKSPSPPHRPPHHICREQGTDRISPADHALGPPSAPQHTVDTRRKEISRHRHNWAPPSTPPDYWNIGFPTTQEAAQINKRAEDMHEHKRKQVELEASKPDGRYRKRQ